MPSDIINYCSIEIGEVVCPGGWLQSPPHIWCHMRYPQVACLASDCRCERVPASLPQVLYYICSSKGISDGTTHLWPVNIPALPPESLIYSLLKLERRNEMVKIHVFWRIFGDTSCSDFLVKATCPSTLYPFLPDRHFSYFSHYF